MATSTSADIYNVVPCTLWVEDDLTRVVLTDFWGDQQIRVLSAAGKDGVHHLVNAAPPELRGKSVIGLVDRDLAPNYPSEWEDRGGGILRTSTHEFENLLLDFDVLSALSGRETTPAAAIQDVAREFAKRIKWWMVCKRVLDELCRDMSAYFPGDPPIPNATALMDRDAAMKHIRASKYWSEHKTLLRTWDSERYVERKIDEWVLTYDGHLTTDEWLRSFSGKEIFRYVRSEVKGLSKLAHGKTETQNDEDLGKRIAGLLRGRFNNTSPTARLFKDLRAMLRTRASLKP